MPQLPSAFTAISNASSSVGSIASFIGVVVDIWPIRTSRNGDHYLSFRMVSEPDQFGDKHAGLYFKSFKRNQDQLPQIGAKGDIVVIRNIKVTIFASKTECISDSSTSTEVITFPARGIPIPQLTTGIAGGAQTLPYAAVPPMTRPTLAEQLYAVELKDALASFISNLQALNGMPMSPTGLTSTLTQASTASAPKLSLIKDMDFMKFYDVQGQVVKLFWSSSGYDLYITDYTENKHLYNYEQPNSNDAGVGEIDPNADPYGYAPVNNQRRTWQGPFGQMTLQVRLWPPHSDWARNNITEGDFVYIRNLRTKCSTYNMLEGNLDQDREHPDKICIRKLGVDKAEIMKRRKEYEKRLLRGQTAADLNEPKKPSALKSERKKEKKKNRKEKQNTAKAEQIKALERKYELTGQQSGNNQNIRCSHPGVRPSTLAEIINNPHRENRTPGGIDTLLPFVNARYRARVRVVDFKPDNLEDFAQPVGDPSYDDLASDAEEDWDGIPKGWEWAFCLLVEDALSTSPEKTRMRLIVANDGAEHLLKMDATDLRKDKQALDNLSEKLFQLWGNLQELKQVKVTLPLSSADSKKLSNLPFDCCIQEYGYFDPDIHGEETNCQRLHRMCGTTIID